MDKLVAIAIAALVSGMTIAVRAWFRRRARHRASVIPFARGAAA